MPYYERKLTSDVIALQIDSVSFKEDIKVQLKILKERKHLA
jgi:hypothetical protein